MASVHEFDDRITPDDPVESPGPFAIEVVAIRKLVSESKKAAESAANAAISASSKVDKLVAAVDTLSNRVQGVEAAVKSHRASIGELSEEQGQALARDALLHKALSTQETRVQKIVRITKPGTTVPVAVVTAVVDMVSRNWQSIMDWIAK